MEIMNHLEPTLISSSFGGRNWGPIVIENIVILDQQVIDKRIKSCFSWLSIPNIVII